jgi:Mn-dependent DtxR family transcriptional regulator
MRILAILSFVSPNSRIAVEALAEDLGVSQGLVSGDLRLLTDLGLGLYWDEGGLCVSEWGYRRILSLIQHGRSNPGGDRRVRS